ncbi:hypothetical protein AVEN_73921-1, partial [Araneus ventricosus]
MPVSSNRLARTINP